ncbi:MAG TPA: hypothetical protein PLI51_01780 [bacterium]|nr:hypothetical protein [bacterium]HPQ65445.1 hypothetical protein [bacterium]
MNCAEFRKNLTLYPIDAPGEFPGGELGAHLRACPRCRREFERIRRLMELTSIWSPPVFGEEEKRRLRARVVRHAGAGPVGRPAPAGTVRMLWRWSVPVAAALAAGIIYISRSPAPEDLPEEVMVLDGLTVVMEDEFAQVGELCAQIDDLDALFNGTAGAGGISES